MSSPSLSHQGQTGDRPPEELKSPEAGQREVCRQGEPQAALFQEDRGEQESDPDFIPEENSRNMAETEPAQRLPAGKNNGREGHFWGQDFWFLPWLWEAPDLG